MRGRSAAARAAALPRRPTMLLLLLCLLPVVATETISNAFFKPINRSCPDTGYFFERDEKGPQPTPCYLCFCKGDDHAVCSLRADTRCDKRLYIHQQRDIKRVRRANTGGLSDIFFRDAAREIFNKNPVRREDCKPHSSKSIGCPPADWCTGCMVCDCDANGHWDCHLMSFCDKNSKSKSVKKSKKTHPKKALDARRVQNSSVKKSNKNTSKNSNTKAPGKTIIKKTVNNAVPQISVKTKKSLMRKDQKDKPMVIKKYISTSSPIKSADLLKHKNNSSKLAQLLYKQYMSNISKAENKIRKRTISDKNMGEKIVNKKGMFKKNIRQTKMKSKKPVNTKAHKNKPKVMRNKQSKKKDGSKKQIKKSSSFKPKKYMGSKFNSSKRIKRDVSFTTEQSIHLTKLEGTEAANGEISNGTEISFTIIEDVKTNINNYAYTVDNHATPSMENNSQSLQNVTEYVTTERYSTIITISDKNYTTTNDVNTYPTVTKIPVSVLNTTDSSFKINTERNDNFKSTQFMDSEISKLNVTFENTKDNTNQSNQDLNRKVFLQDIRKMNFGKKKFNLKKLVKTLNSRIKYTKDNYNFMNKSLSDSKSTRHKIDGTLNDIQNLLERMLHGVAKNNKTKERLKSKSFTAIKYLKKLFSKLFTKSKNKPAIEKEAVIDSICENFGPCRSSTKKLAIVNYKVEELISETLKALRSIKIIKGILSLFYDHKIKNITSTPKEPDFKVHLKNLNAILKDQFSTEDKLTQTQVTQINYIKSNTQIFIKSLGKFASILNDIIGIIKSDNEYYKFKQAATIQNKKRNKSIEQGGSISKMKQLLLRYNLLQNTFLRKMYEALSNVQQKVTTERVKEVQNNNSMNNVTYKIAIEMYIDNINENLKKLKDLAARMDSKTRRKRDARDDDAIEYLLTLMEYLLKKNNPIDAPPVKDGIDLLIEAIRRAPDIKPIPKPELQYIPVEIAGATSSAVSKEESDSKSNNENSTEDTKTHANNKSGEDSTDNDIIQEDRRIPAKIAIEVTTKPTQNFIDLSDVITEYPSKVYMATFNTYDNTDKPFDDRTPATVTPIRKNSDIDAIILDDDDLKMVRKAEIDLETGLQSSSSTARIFTEAPIEGPKMRQFIPIKKPYPVATIEPLKTKLDLINEAYEQEIKELKEHTTPRTTVIIRVKGETGKRDHKLASSDISSITKEIVDGDKEKSIDTEKVVYRKQMELLNSLDYGTDRSLIDDSESKDNSPVDRLTNEAFSSY